MSGGFFGSLFDFNGDGELDTFERTMDIMAFNELMEETERAENEEDGEDDYEYEFR